MKQMTIDSENSGHVINKLIKYSIINYNRGKREIRMGAGEEGAVLCQWVVDCWRPERWTVSIKY